MSQTTRTPELSELTTIAKEVQFGRAWVGLAVRNRQIAKQLFRRWEEVFQQWAMLYGFDEFRLSLPDGSYIGISSSLSATSEGVSTIRPEALQSVYTSPAMPINQELYSFMQRLIESDRPMFLLTNDTDQQVWINQHACDMIQSTGEEAVRRCIRDYWEGSDWESLHQKIRDTSQPFEHPYRAILNDVQNDVWFEAVSRYEPVEINGRSFRLSVNQHFEVIGTAQLQTAR